MLLWGGATSADSARCWGGTRAWRGGVFRLARTRSVRSRRVCVRALRVCVWSQFPPSATLPDLGERAVYLRLVSASLPSLTSILPPPRGLGASPGLTGTGKTGPASFSTEPFSETLLAPCGPPTRRSLFWSSPCCCPACPRPPAAPRASHALH